MARAAAVIVGGAKAGNRHAPTRRPLQHFRQVLLQFPASERIPNLDRFGKRQQIINVPVRLSHGLQVMMNPGAEAPGTESAAHVGVKAGDYVVSAQAPDLQPLHLRDEDDQDISPVGLGQFHAHQSSARSPGGDIFTSLGSNWPRMVTWSLCAAMTSRMFL